MPTEAFASPLIVWFGPNRYTFPVGRDVTIGRDSRADIRVDGAGTSISPTHVVLHHNGRQWIAVDRGEGGIYVDGVRMSTVFIHDGRAITLGDPQHGPRLVFQLGAPPPPPPPATPATEGVRRARRCGPRRRRPTLHITDPADQDGRPPLHPHPGRISRNDRRFRPRLPCRRRRRLIASTRRRRQATGTAAAHFQPRQRHPGRPGPPNRRRRRRPRSPGRRPAQADWVRRGADRSDAKLRPQRREPRPHEPRPPPRCAGRKHRRQRHQSRPPVPPPPAIPVPPEPATRRPANASEHRHRRPLAAVNAAASGPAQTEWVRRGADRRDAKTATAAPRTPAARGRTPTTDAAPRPRCTRH